ncbi:MAG: chemotaxis protein CheW [Sulfuricella sp.]|nr:chemotaxis protein CheW [Sulfuricella sp.]
MSATAELHIHDCWNRIGVWGRETPRCPKLVQFTHCYNCDVYQAAGRMLHARALPAGYQAEWTEIVASRKQAHARTGLAAVVFRIGREWLAVPAGLVDEIVELRAVHGLPHRSSPILLGLVNIRGKLQLAVDIAELLGIAAGGGAALKKEHRSIYPRMLVVHNEQHRFVFAADEVLGTHRYAAKELESLPATLSGALTKYSAGALRLGDRNVGLLDHELLLYAFSRSLA